MHSDEEVKDGRYFPSPQEQAILTQQIDKYFQLPERSEERSLCVQQVTAQLANINPRWTNRSVRLWFNNNKRTCLKQNSVQFDPSQVRAAPLTVEQMPPKKRPPRSASVGANLGGFGYVGQPQTALPTDMYYVDRFRPIFERLQGEQTEEKKKEIESDLNELLIECENRAWAENIGAMQANRQLTVQGGMGEKVRKVLANPPEAHEYASIDCATFVNGSPVVISESRLFVGNAETEVEFDFPPAAVSFDRYTNSLFVVSGTSMFPVKFAEKEVGPGVDLGCGILLRSTVATWPDAIAVGAKSNLVMMGRDGSSAPVMYESGLRAVTSLAPIGPMMAVASRNHHAVHIVDHQGKVVHRCLGHGAGVTCLSSANDRTLLSGSADKTARLWDIHTSIPAVQLQRHRCPLTVVYDYWHQGREYVVTGSEDHLVRLWDLRMPMDLLLETDVGSDRCRAGVPIAVELGESTIGEPDVLMVITKEKDTTTSEGLRNKDAILETNPNRAVRFHFV